MLENPYEPPKTRLHETQAGEAAPPRRFRFRLIPATLCFVFGGLGVAAWVFQAVLIAALLMRAGLDRFNIGAIVIVLVAQLGCFSLIVFGGWFLLRGRWFRA